MLFDKNIIGSVDHDLRNLIILKKILKYIKLAKGVEQILFETDSLGYGHGFAMSLIHYLFPDDPKDLIIIQITAQIYPFKDPMPQYLTNV